MDPLIKLPSKKSRNLFVHPENKRPQAPCPVFFSLRTVKNYPLFSGLKTPQSTLTLTIRKKHNFQAPLPIRFSSVHCQKSVIYSYLSYKNAATLVTASNQGKKTLSGSCPYVSFYPSTLLKIIFTTVKTNFLKHRIVNPQFSNRKKRHLRLLAVLFFPFTHCQKTLSYFFFSSKTPQHLAPCSQSEKTHTFRLLPVRVFSAHC